MNLEDTLNENKSVTKRKTVHNLTCPGVSNMAKSIQIENRVMATRGWETREEGAVF